MNHKALIEAALFMANEPLSLREMKEITALNEREIKKILAELKTDLQNQERGVYLIETKEGFQMRVKQDYVSAVRHLTPYQDLGKGLLRVLALVAYKQPITQAEIVKVIGNRTYEYVKSLESRGLIRAVKQGRTKALVATKEFAEYFGIERLEDAKKFFKEQMEGNEEEKEIKSG